MIYTVTLNPSLDYIVCTDALRPGKLCRTSGETLYPGGKGVNVSWSAQHWVCPRGHWASSLGGRARFLVAAGGNRRGI